MERLKFSPASSNSASVEQHQEVDYRISSAASIIGSSVRVVPKATGDWNLSSLKENDL